MLRLSHIRWVFFDLGNTLINEKQAVDDRIGQIRRVLSGLGKQVSVEAIEEAFEEASTEFAPRLITRALEKLVDDPANRTLVLQRVRYRKEMEAPYPQAHELLTQLAARYRIGVIANQSAGTERRLREYGLCSGISLCLASAEVGLAKPDAAIFRLALERAGCEPHQAVMVGDRLDSDIRPAKQLGWRTIRVLQGFARVQMPRDEDEEPDLTVHGLEEIHGVLC
jgi:HAD superfamily hydrolase (TIGR01549 family)